MADEIDIAQLCAAVQRSRLVLRQARQNRFDLAREAAGHRFSEGGAVRPVKVNLLATYQTIIGNLLVARNPRYKAVTSDRAYRAQLRLECDWLNEQCVRMMLFQSGRQVVEDALYATGIAKVALATPCDAARQAWDITAGEPIVTPIDLDDFVYDVAAREFSEATYIGHRYRCPLKVAQEVYGQKARQLTADTEFQYNRDGDERIQQILRGTYSPEEFEEHVELWELYLPRHKCVVTLHDTDVAEMGRDGRAKPLWKQDWVGPPWGPFHFLRFGRVPGAAMAKAPMMDLMEMHLDMNNVHRKANNTLRRMKEVTVYRRNQDADAEALANANDGDFVPSDAPDMMRPVVTAGQAVQGLFIAAENYKSLFDFLAGNLSLLGGRAAQSKTATQDKILAQNAGSGIEHMHGHVEQWFASVGESLLWYAHHHPELVMSSEYAKGGYGEVRRLRPADRQQLPFHRGKLTLVPYSVRHRTPEERLAFVTTVVQQMMPMMPLLAAQGLGLDANKLIGLFADYGDSPEIEELFIARAAPGDDGASPGVPHDKTLPAQTERSYTRNSTSEGPGPAQQLAEMGADAFGGGAA